MISITMRTPGQDEDLAIGFLFTEGIIQKQQEVNELTRSPLDENHLIIKLKEKTKINIGLLQRHFYTSSSCGICGKASLDAVRAQLPPKHHLKGLTVRPQTLYSLPKQLIDHQSLFSETGGIHAAALFSKDGKLLLLREDVGRHNAVDKLIGATLLKKFGHLDEHILLVSGRASFELVQKALMANIQILAAIGAPSSLAIALAQENKMTLIGFLKDHSFNIYTGQHLIELLE